jgi:phosphopantothenate synthetase
MTLDADHSIDLTSAKSKVEEDLGRVIDVVLVDLNDGDTGKASEASGGR